MIGEKGKVTTSAQHPPDAPRTPEEGNEQLVAGTSDERRRATRLYQATLILVIGAIAAASTYLLVYGQTGVWQLLAEVGFVAVALVFAVVAYGLTRWGKFDAAGYCLLFGVLSAYGGGELLLANATLYFAVGGVLLIIVAGSMVLPRRWRTWLLIAGLLSAHALLVHWFEPLPRYDITQSTLLHLITLGVSVVVVLVFLWQIGRALRIGTIRTRLLISFVSMALVLTAVISGGAITRGIISAQQQVRNQLESVAVLKEAEINTWMDNLQIDLGFAVAGSDVMRNTRMLLQGELPAGAFQAVHSSLQTRFRKVIDQTGRFDELFLMDLEGKVVLSTDAAQEGTKIHKILDYFREGLKGPYVQPPFYSPTLERTSIVVSQPVVDAQGQVIGVLAGHANLAILDEIMGERTGLGTTGETYLVGARYILRTTTRFGDKGIYVSTFGTDEAIAKQVNGFALYDNYRGEPIVGVYRWLPKLQMVLLAEQTQAEALQPVYMTLGMIAVMALLSMGFAAGASLVVTRSIATPLAGLAETATQIAAGDLERTARVERRDEIGVLAQAFNRMTTQLRDLIAGLERRVADRTRDLEQRSAYLEAAAEVGHAATSILETDRLINQVVELIRERFGLYYVGLFLLDETDEWAVLRAGTGEAGQAMLARGHRIRVGEGMIGWSIAHEQARVALYAEEDAVRLAMTELPDTRSEAALPLRSRGQVLGALTVQSDQPEAFDQDTVVVLQTMADQVAVALDNARLFTASQEALETTRRAYGELSRELWSELLHARPDLGYRSDARSVTAAEHIWRPEMEQALRKGQTVQGSSLSAAGSEPGERQPLAVPIKVRGEVIGVLDTYKPGEAGAWTREEIALLEAMVDQLGVALDSARLYQDSQRRAARERIVGEVTQRMRGTLDVDTVLRTAADEMYQALELDEIVIRLARQRP